MTAGTTYSRTSGLGILPGTWRAVKARHPSQALNPQDRLSWDESTQAQRAQFLALALQDKTRPPEFLRFDLARNPYTPGNYPASVPASEGRPANGHLRAGQILEDAAKRLGISPEQLKVELGKFSGPVSVLKLLAGQTIFRTIGLTAKSVERGSITNRLLGDYWEPDCPDTYASVDEWRQKTAVLAEWNGDHGYLEVKGSANRRKAINRLGRLHARIARQRSDWLHKLTTGLAAEHPVIAIEDLQVQGMSASARGTAAQPGKQVRQKAGLNRAILDAAWAEFRRQLAYKLAWRGGQLVLVNPAFTSQQCSACGHTAADNRRTQSSFLCLACGHAENADINAAKNILAAGHAVWQGQAPAKACGAEVRRAAPAKALHAAAVKQEPTEELVHA